MKRLPVLIRFSLILWVCFVCSVHLFAQQVVVTSAKIIHSGDLYSTYNLKENATELAKLEAQVPASLVKEILDNSTESSWVEGIATLDARNRNRAIIADYIVYKVAELSDAYVLVIPFAKNKQMPSEMRSDKDFYFVIGKNGVEIGTETIEITIPDSPANPYDAEVGVEMGLSIAKIINPMELMSNFILANSAVAKQLFVPIVGGEAQFLRMSELANEKTWPDGINSYEAREKVRAKMKDYHSYFVGSFEGNSLLYIPESENQHMPENMRPLTEEGIFFVLKSSGVSVDNVEEAAPSMEIPAYTVGDFDSELYALIKGMESKFEAIKGDEIKVDNDMAALLDTEYACKIPLTGAQNVVVKAGKFNNQSYLFAEIGEYKDPSEAKAKYKEWADKVSKAKKPCGTMVEDQQNLDNLQTTYWIPFDLSGTMHKGYESMVIEVMLLKTIGFDKDYKVYDEYSLSLKIYKQK